MEISLCMIVKNEEINLNNCLKSVEGVFDEIVIVDTGSKDKTKEVAEKYNCNIFDFTWANDFAAARNFAFSKSTKEYIMWLDADDILLPIEKEKLVALKSNLEKSVDVVFMNYQTKFSVDGSLIESTTRERIVKRTKNFKWASPVHEYIKTSGEYLFTDIIVTHTGKFSDSNRNYLILKEQINKPNCDSALHFYYAIELLERKELDESIKNFTAFIEKNGETNSFYRSACLGLYFSYKEKGQNEKAVDILLKCVENGCVSSEIYCQLGYFSKDILQDFDYAIHWFSMASKVPIPKGHETFSILNEFYYFVPYFELGNCYIKKNRIEDALLNYHKALTFNQNNLDVINIINLIDKHQGNQKK